ncbi:hypothetical protein [Amycolatopsis albispora]|uniref:DUF3558 domain-containing protein n=1 Tax=Amycolatopsis albispora TaxID=1804986 RepID=A0A344LIN3_9PSEU|nr:hypothetical protein [Amycolatopsis albispora]AXB47907.1 hypothetical protein A4R43_40175 [Amycolatopsis albispora]
MIMQPGYPPPQGYQGQQGYQPGYPGYPGYPPPKKSNTGLIVTLCLVGVLLLAGLGVGAYFLIDSGSSSSRSASSGPAPSTETGPPDRFQAVPGCAEVERRVTGLPEKMTDEAKDHGTSDPDVTMTGHSCLWDSGDSPIRVELSFHLSASLPGKSGAGTDAASRYFDTMAGQGSQNGSADVPGADRASRTSFSNTDCSIHVLVGNVYIGATYYADEDAGVTTATCESDVLKVATAATEAVSR